MFMDLTKAGKATALYGNHEDMMLDHLYQTHIYGHNIWHCNGGGATLKSYDQKIPEAVIGWVGGLPLYQWLPNNVLASHSFPAYGDDLQQACKITFNKQPSFVDAFERSIIWNREEPRRFTKVGKPTFQVAGHNSQFGLEWFSDGEGAYALCIDTSQSKLLTGVSWDSDLPFTIDNVEFFMEMYPELL